MKFSLVEKRKTYHLWAFIFGAIILLAIVFLMKYNLGGIFVATIFLLRIFISPKLFYKNFGKLEINENQILIQQEQEKELSFSNNSDLKIVFVYDASRVHPTVKNFIAGGFVIELQLFEENKLANKTMFYVKNNDRSKFVELLKGFYKEGKNLSEKDELGAKCFLLKSNFKYREIQDIKRDYNISW